VIKNGVKKKERSIFMIKICCEKI